MNLPQTYKTLVEFFRNLPKKSCSLLLAVSGGSDSTALVHLCFEIIQLTNINKIAIAHVNHCLRGAESQEDEVFVKKLAEFYKCQFFCKRLSGLTMYSSGLEEKARKERYDFFHELKNEHGFDYIVTAHTADDQAETVIQRLLRGTGIGGLRAIHEKRSDGVIRPLLNLSKKELTSWLELKGYSYRTDSSNTDVHFRRNFIRHRVMPIFEEVEPNSVRKIAAIAYEAERICAIIDELVKKWLNENLKNDNPLDFEINKNAIKTSSVALDAIRYLLRSHGIEADAFHVNSIMSSADISGGRFLLPHGWSFYPLSTTIRFIYDEADCAAWSFDLKIPGITEVSEKNVRIKISESDGAFNDSSSQSVIVDSKKCGRKLIYRKVDKKDVFIPFGRKNSVSVLHFLSKQGIPKIERENIGVIADSENSIVWIPLIRLSESHKIGKTADAALKITFQPL